MAAALARAAARRASRARAARWMMQAAAARSWYCGRHVRCTTIAARLHHSRGWLKHSSSQSYNSLMMVNASGHCGPHHAQRSGDCKGQASGSSILIFVITPHGQEAGAVPAGGRPQRNDRQRRPPPRCLGLCHGRCLRTQRGCLFQHPIDVSHSMLVLYESSQGTISADQRRLQFKTCVLLLFDSKATIRHTPVDGQPSRGPQPAAAAPPQSAGRSAVPRG